MKTQLQDACIINEELSLSTMASHLESMLKNKSQPDILVVDDVPDNIRFLSNFLTEQGYDVRKAISGGMALKAVKALMPDLILLDVNMPEMSGYDVCSYLKADPFTCSVPIIFLSADREVFDKVKAFQVGGADYITKPFQLEEVLVKIQTQLTIRELQQKQEKQNIQLQQALSELNKVQVNLVQQEKKAMAVQNFLNEIDQAFVASDLNNLIHSMNNEAERIRSVILALRSFTHIDENHL